MSEECTRGLRDGLARSGLVEGRVFDDTRKSYETAARFTSEYVREKGW